MSDKLREALDYLDRLHAGTRVSSDSPQAVVLAAARAYSDTQEPDYGKASNVLRLYVRETTIGFGRLAEEVVDAAIAGRRLVVEIEEERKK